MRDDHRTRVSSKHLKIRGAIVVPVAEMKRRVVSRHALLRNHWEDKEGNLRCWYQTRLTRVLGRAVQDEMVDQCPRCRRPLVDKDYRNNRRRRKAQAVKAGRAAAFRPKLKHVQDGDGNRRCYYTSIMCEGYTEAGRIACGKCNRPWFPCINQEMWEATTAYHERRKERHEMARESLRRWRRRWLAGKTTVQPPKTWHALVRVIRRNSRPSP